MEYEIYNTQNGRRVNINGQSYALEVFSGRTNSFNVADAYNGSPEDAGDTELGAWLRAAREVGMPLRYSWQGVMNGLGHHNTVSPPWKAKPRDYNRDDSIPVDTTERKFWIEWKPGKWVEYNLLTQRSAGGVFFNAHDTWGEHRIATNAPNIFRGKFGSVIEEGHLQEPIIITSAEELPGEVIPWPVYQHREVTLTFDQVKALVQKMGEGTATPEEEASVEEYALEKWGHDRKPDERVIVLGDCTPGGSGQSHYQSVRDCLDQTKAWAAQWPDTLHYHPRLGWVEDGMYEGRDVYAAEYRVEKRGTPETNVIRIRAWQEGEYHDLVSFPCAQGIVRDEEDMDRTTPERYIFSWVPRCPACQSFGNVLVVCPECLEKALKKGDCRLDQKAHSAIIDLQNLIAQHGIVRSAANVLLFQKGGSPTEQDLEDLRAEFLASHPD